jgi:glycosyltransferase involved in cell wall biosynthesis
MEIHRVMTRPLRILMMLHMPWSQELGGSRVQMELAEEFVRRGHHVEKFDSVNAFGSDAPSSLTLAASPYRKRAAAFVRQHGHRFDVIDAHQGNLPFTKDRLGFGGLLVARSVGLYLFYERCEAMQRSRWPDRPRKSMIRSILGGARRFLEEPDYRRSLETADLINLCNRDELETVRDEFGWGEKSIVLPFGLSESRRAQLAPDRTAAVRRLSGKRVAFIGSWGLRKGSGDWGSIVARLRSAVPGVRFRFLGTSCSRDRVIADLGCEVAGEAAGDVEVIPTYRSSDLPALLKETVVGAFPSYCEGFPFAVLEKLASGLPVVAYDVAGSREMLGRLERFHLVAPGDVAAFVESLRTILISSEERYAELSDQAVSATEKYRWSGIAAETLDIYESRLEALSQESRSLDRRSK